MVRLKRLLIAIVLLFPAFFTAPVQAQTVFNVNTTVDRPDWSIGDFGPDGLCDWDPETEGDQCTLRAAVQEANYSEGSVTINIPAGTYVLDFGDPFEDASEGDLNIGEEGDLTALTINGAGQSSTVIDGNGNDRIFNINWVTVTINDVTIQNGAPPSEGGGGIRSYYATLTLNNVTVTNNSSYEGGGIYAYGGFVSEPTPLTLNNSTVTGNEAFDAGGGIYAYNNDVHVNDSTVASNSAYYSGGGVYLSSGFEEYASLFVTRSQVSTNTSMFNGAGIWVYGLELSITDSSITGNTISGEPTGGLAPAGLEPPPDEGGPSFTVESGGGGIYIEYVEEGRINNTTISGNFGDTGGGIFNYEGDVTVTNSTLGPNNSAFQGGGLYNYDGYVELVNTTVSGNSARDEGGGIFNYYELMLVNVTVTDNEAEEEGGGIYDEFDEGTYLVNTLIANNTAIATPGNCNAVDAFFSQGNNLSTDATCGLDEELGDLIVEDAGLGSLAANGGPTRTHKLLSTSPAVDAGDIETCAEDAVLDQRGHPRFDGNRDNQVACDIGAFEFERLFCGDRIVVGGDQGVLGKAEQCDDGNAVGGDGCSAACQLEGCGNGVLDLGELCDDGNQVSGDGCPATCTILPGDFIVRGDLPGDFDGDGDGVPDNLQSGLAHVFTEEVGILTLATADAVCALTAGPDPAITLETALLIINLVFGESDAACVAGQQGIVSFARTRPDQPQEQSVLSSTVNVYFEEKVRVNAVHVFGSTPNNPEPHLYDFFFDGETGAEVLNDRIILHFVDGARGDNDLTVNGLITFSGGPVFAVSPVTAATVEGRSVELKLLNPAGGVDTIQVSETDASGAAVSDVDVGPLSVRQTQSVPAADVISSEDGEVALTARGREGLIQSLFLIADEAGTKLDAVDGDLTASGRLLLPGVEGEGTTLFVFNPGVEAVPGVLFDLISAAGTTVSRVTRDIEAGGFVKETTIELFGSASTAGSVRIGASSPLVAFAILEGADSMRAIAAQTSRVVSRLWAPHFFVDADGGTRISLFNDHGSVIATDITAYDDAGTALGTLSRLLASNELLDADVGELLGLEEGSSGYLEVSVRPTGWFVIFSRQARAVGTATFSMADGTAQTTIPLQAGGRTETTFLQAVPVEGTYTGLSIVNPGPQTATVTARAYDASGQEVASRQIELAAGARVSDLLSSDEFFGEGFSQTGHLELSSDQRVVSFVLSGDFGVQFLSGTGGQTGIR